jgi:hypothetical protein
MGAAGLGASFADSNKEDPLSTERAGELRREAPPEFMLCWMWKKGCCVCNVNGLGRFGFWEVSEA